MSEEDVGADATEPVTQEFEQEPEGPEVDHRCHEDFNDDGQEGNHHCFRSKAQRKEPF